MGQSRIAANPIWRRLFGLKSELGNQRGPSPAEGHHMSFVILLYSTFGRLSIGKAARQRFHCGPSALSGTTEGGSAAKTLLCCGVLAELAHNDHCV